eukprot:TRINITY_DN28124_c0_g1_i1.p1 TRINITY_DN28124_c0_g1~~TRINITY_DN28124_c0_g1_i1.p1  ORF type:complete len:694 (-),score=63.72 TRINITY_DN28124_c0_g1_i1:349-2352(-)
MGQLTSRPEELEREALVHDRSSIPWILDCRSASCSESLETFPSQLISDGLEPPQLILARRRLFSSHLQLKFRSFYRNEQQVGEGSYGSVCDAICLTDEALLQASASPSSGKSPTGPKPDTGGTAPGGGFSSDNFTRRRVAVKAFSLYSDSRDVSSEREIAAKRASYERERSILSHIEHPHIVRMFECFEERSALYIVMELCRGGELYVQIVHKSRERSTGGGFTEAPSRRFFRQMLFATSYLHARRIVHRDIKTENFLLLGHTPNPEDDTIKLCDFGTAVQLTNQMPRAMERSGTLSYTAPEIYQKEGCDTIADAWSLGVVLYVLLVGASPFRQSGNEAREDTIRRICAGDYDRSRPAWTVLSRQSVDLIAKLIVVNERHRMSTADALNHRWVDQQPVRARYAAYTKYAPAVLQLLLRFANLHAMQQLALLVCAQTMGEVELLELMKTFPLYDIFITLDSDQDGALSFREFAHGLQMMLGSSCTIEMMFPLLQSIDVDGNGYVDWIEWVAVALLSVSADELYPEPLASAFRLLDRPSGDSKLGVADLIAVINSDSTRQLESERVREWALMLIEPWASATDSLEPRRLAPSLSLWDFKQLVESALSQPDAPANLEMALAAHARAMSSPSASPASLRWCVRSSKGNQPRHLRQESESIKILDQQAALRF